MTNSPIRYSDPSGHRNCEEDGYNCPGDKITTKKTPQLHFHWDVLKDKLSGNLSAASFLPGYNIIKSNLDQAWKIITNSRATFGQRLGASTYTTVAWGAYAVYAIGSVIAMKGGGGKEPTSLPNGALVCRGGTCTAERFANASGATTNSDGTLNGVSVNSAADSSFEALTQGIPNKQVGVTTAGDIRAAGGNVYPKPLDNNPYHAEINGLTPAQLESLFTPTRPNPNP